MCATTTTPTTKKVGWGRPDIYVKDLDAATPEWLKVPTPVENTSKLVPSKGEKLEAKIEGGDNEDVLYKANNYDLSYQIRKTSGKDMPIKHSDGVVDHRYAVVVVPQNRLAPGPYVPQSSVTVEDAFDTKEGGTDLFTHSAVKPSDDGKKVRWGTYEVTDTNGKITIKASGGDFGTTPVAL